jgi:hypothetical protein
MNHLKKINFYDAYVILFGNAGLSELFRNFKDRDISYSLICLLAMAQKDQLPPYFALKKEVADHSEFLLRIYKIARFRKRGDNSLST